MMAILLIRILCASPARDKPVVLRGENPSFRGFK
jgi:hypothetical protein